jgi:hypothetical protein
MLTTDLPRIVHGSLADGDAKVWADSGQTILWPDGYYATFTPELTVYDASDHLRGQEGENMSTESWHEQRACITGGPSEVMYAPDAIIEVFPARG